MSRDNELVELAKEYIGIQSGLDEIDKKMSALKTEEAAQRRRQKDIEKDFYNSVGNNVQQKIIPVDHRAVLIRYAPAIVPRDTPTIHVDVVKMTRQDK